MPKLNPELEKLSNFLEKYVEALRVEVNRCEEKLKSEDGGKQSSELQSQKQELETKIEKVQSYLDKIRVSEDSSFIELGKPKKHWGSTEGLDKPLCERYDFLVGEKWITLDIPHSLLKELEVEVGKDIPYPFYLSASVLEKEEVCKGITIEKKEEIFIQKSLSGEETNKGKIAGVLGGVGAGAAGGAAAGAGAMVALSPLTFGMSLYFTPAAATIGAIAGGLGVGTTGLAVGSITDKISNSKIAEIKNEIKGFLEDYKAIVEKESPEYKEVEVYIESSNYWK